MTESVTPVILQVLPALQSGGVERGTLEIARAISQAGWKPLVASSGGPMAAQLARYQAAHYTLPLDKKNPLAIFSNARKLATIIRIQKVNIVHARSRAPAWSAWLACKWTGAKFMTTFHGTYNGTGRFKKLYNSIMVRGERVIAISQFIVDHIKQNYTVDESRIRLIHRGVDLKLFVPDSASSSRLDALIREWRLPPDHPVILFPGRITRWKGQDIFLQALASLPHRNFIAVILGDDKKKSGYREELEKMIVDLKLEGHVRFENHTQSMKEAYTIARIVVATSIEPEAFGRVVIEAQAMGKPVIASNIGGPQETVLHGQTGLLVPPGDVAGLAASIENAMTMDADLHEQVKRDAIAQAQLFSVEKMCEKTLAVYRELL